jgi:hypothetical protein
VHSFLLCENSRRSSPRLSYPETIKQRRFNYDLTIGHRDLARNETRAWFSLRHEEGELLARSVGFFTAKSSKAIGLPDTTWPVTSRELALMFSPLGYRKLSSIDGVLRGEAVGASYPVFHNSWRDKRATHEVCVGTSGFWQDICQQLLPDARIRGKRNRV